MKTCVTLRRIYAHLYNIYTLLSIHNTLIGENSRAGIRKQQYIIAHNITTTFFRPWNLRWKGTTGWLPLHPNVSFWSVTHRCRPIGWMKLQRTFTNPPSSSKQQTNWSRSRTYTSILMFLGFFFYIFFLPNNRYWCHSYAVVASATIPRGGGTVGLLSENFLDALLEVVSMHSHHAEHFFGRESHLDHAIGLNEMVIKTHRICCPKASFTLQLSCGTTVHEYPLHSAQYPY